MLQHATVALQYRTFAISVDKLERSACGSVAREDGTVWMAPSADNQAPNALYFPYCSED
jgi:hypothetical protein